jgi:hypothetical protein
LSSQTLYLPCDAGLPRPDLTVRGLAFAASFDAWIGALAAVLSDLTQ